jgi:hypothetical protein
MISEFFLDLYREMVHVGEILSSKDAMVEVKIHKHRPRNSLEMRPAEKPVKNEK